MSFQYDQIGVVNAYWKGDVSLRATKQMPFRYDQLGVVNEY